MHAQEIHRDFARLRWILRIQSGSDLPCFIWCRDYFPMSNSFPDYLAVKALKLLQCCLIRHQKHEISVRRTLVIPRRWTQINLTQSYRNPSLSNQTNCQRLFEMEKTCTAVRWVECRKQKSWLSQCASRQRSHNSKLWHPDKILSFSATEVMQWHRVYSRHTFPLVE